MQNLLNGHRTVKRPASRVAAVLLAAALLPAALHAQDFGRNKVAYKVFDFSVLSTEHFRIFHYPAQGPAGTDWSRSWGVGEHTDYGLLTLLAQDRHGGLQVKTPDGWIAAPPIEGALVCNIGDMLERLTGGRFVSTPHRVMNVSGQDRLSFPLFFDPDFAAPMRPLPGVAVDRSRWDADRRQRWDAASVHDFEGPYGDYLLGKVAKVFPQLMEGVL